MTRSELFYVLSTQPGAYLALHISEGSQPPLRTIRLGGVPDLPGQRIPERVYRALRQHLRPTWEPIQGVGLPPSGVAFYRLDQGLVLGD